MTGRDLFAAGRINQAVPAPYVSHPARSTSFGKLSGSCAYGWSMGVSRKGRRFFFGFEMDGQVAIDDEGMAFHIRPGVPVLSSSRK